MRLESDRILLLVSWVGELGCVCMYCEGFVAFGLQVSLSDFKSGPRGVGVSGFFVSEFQFVNRLGFRVLCVLFCVVS